VAEDHTPERANDPPDPELDLAPEVEALVEDSEFDPDDDSDSAVHYLQDPNHLADNARDEDEQEQDDVLDVDQAELEELGLTLDDPHQPDTD
jgi:hypothetical protein